MACTEGPLGKRRTFLEIPALFAIAPEKEGLLLE